MNPWWCYWPTRGSSGALRGAPDGASGERDSRRRAGTDGQVLAALLAAVPAARCPAQAGRQLLAVAFLLLAICSGVPEPAEFGTSAGRRAAWPAQAWRKTEARASGSASARSAASARARSAASARARSAGSARARSAGSAERAEVTKIEATGAAKPRSAKPCSAKPRPA